MTNFAHAGFTIQRYFIEAPRAVHDERAVDAKFGEHQSDFFHHLVGKNADHLRARPSRIG